MIWKRQARQHQSGTELLRAPELVGLRNEYGDQPARFSRQNVGALKELGEVRLDRDGKVVLETLSYLQQDVVPPHGCPFANSGHGNDRMANRSTESRARVCASERDRRGGALGGVVQRERGRRPEPKAGGE